MADPFQLNDHCEIHSLQSPTAQHLNGLQVTIIAHLPDKGRYRCQLLHNLTYKNIKPTNLISSLPGRITYYVQTLQATNESQDLIDAVVAHASDVETWGHFDLPLGMGIPYAFSHERPGIDPFVTGETAVPGPLGAKVSVIHNVIYLLNLKRKWSCFPNNNPAGHMTPTLLHVDLTTLDQLLQHLQYALEYGKNLPCVTRAWYEEERKCEQIVYTAHHATRTYKATEETVSRCAHCATTSTSTKLRLCSGCKSIFFCSTQCLKNHWSLHRIECKRLSSLKKDGETDGGKSKARALQIIGDVQSLTDVDTTFHMLTFSQYHLKRVHVIRALHETAEYKHRKVLKWGIKHGVLELWRDVVLAQDMLMIEQAHEHSEQAISMVSRVTTVSLVDLLLVVEKKVLPPGVPPTADLSKMKIFLNDNEQGCIGFWNLMKIAEILYRTKYQPAEVQARFIVRQFSKIFSCIDLATIILPTLTKKRCTILIFLSTSFDFNQYDRSGAMQYLAMSIIACFLAQGAQHPELMPASYDKKKWLYTPAIRKEKIFNGFVMPCFEFATKNNRMITQNEIDQFLNTFQSKGR